MFVECKLKYVILEILDRDLDFISFEILRFNGHQQGPLSQLAPRPLGGQPLLSIL